LKAPLGVHAILGITITGTMDRAAGGRGPPMPARVAAVAFGYENVLSPPERPPAFWRRARRSLAYLPPALPAGPRVGVDDLGATLARSLTMRRHLGP